MQSPSAIAGKTLPRTPSTRNLVVGVGAVEGVSYGDGVARVGLTRGVVYHQKVKANRNRLQTNKQTKKRSRQMGHIARAEGDVWRRHLGAG